MFDAFRGLDANRRFLVLSLAVVLLVAAVFLGRIASAPEYVPLYQGVALSDMAKMTDGLTKAAIPYQLSAEGNSILVPRGDAARARVALAQNGLPADGRPGLELFDQPSWGMTDFTQHVTYRRALEGELARTIGNLRGVERAQVHIGLPESSPLRRLERPAQAAVVLSLTGTEPLSGEQVRGIAQLVANSVERLAVDDVAVLDDSGRPLTGLGGSESSGMALSSRQLELQQSVEKHLATKVEQMLTTAVGVGDVRVQVAAQLNFDQLDRTTEAYDPNGRVLEKESRSDGGDSASAPVGAPRIVNLEYKTSRTVEKVISGTGNVVKLSVSAMVNSRALDGGAGLPEEQRVQLEQLARTAVGFDSLRGDQVTVLAVPFGGPTPERVIPVTKEEVPTTSLIDTATRLTYPVASVLAVLVALMLGMRALKPGPAAPARASALPGQDVASGVLPAAATPEAAQLRVRAQGDSLAAPEASARVVRSWLAEPTS